MPFDWNILGNTRSSVIGGNGACRRLYYYYIIIIIIIIIIIVIIIISMEYGSGFTKASSYRYFYTDTRRSFLL